MTKFTQISRHSEPQIVIRSIATLYPDELAVLSYALYTIDHKMSTNILKEL